MSTKKVYDKPRSHDLLELRRHVAIVMRNSNEGRRYFVGSDKEWNRQIDKLEGSGVYENDCGDLMLPALAHSLGVDILVFNTSRRSVPFYPVSSTVWGGEKSSKPPLLLIYDEVHYETALPATDHDSQLTIEVMEQWKAERLPK